MAIQSPILLCIPGFLGIPADFALLDSLNLPLTVIDICGKDAPNSFQDWQSWQEQFLSKLEEDFPNRLIVILGYSMGARIALKLLEASTGRFVAAVLLSGHPGLNSDQEKKERMLSDLKWSERFEKEDLRLVLADWANQPVFRMTSEISRDCNNYDASTLANVLRTFSLSKQEVLKANSVNVPSLICCGEYDLKFKLLASQLADIFQCSQIVEVPKAGHRLLIDNNSYLVEKIREFIVSQGFGS